MNLDYWILWFEDTPSWLDSMVEELTFDLEELGFRLKVQNCVDGTDLAKYVVDSKYDLILMDYNLKKIDGKNINGDELIRQIRKDQNILTEVIFYSVKSADELRDMIFENGKLDGVYCFQRLDKEFSSFIMKIIDTTIKKVLDTNNMRGMAMASVADCDQHVINSVVARWEQLEGDEKIALKEKALEKFLLSQKKLEENLEKLRSEDDLRTILENNSYSSETRFHVLNSITKPKKKCPEIGPLRSTIQEYPELLKTRNILGHAKANENNGVVVFEGKDKSQYGREEFTDLRKKMINQEQALNSMFNLIRDQKLD